MEIALTKQGIANGAEGTSAPLPPTNQIKPSWNTICYVTQNPYT